METIKTELLNFVKTESIYSGTSLIFFVFWCFMYSGNLNTSNRPIFRQIVVQRKAQNVNNSDACFANFNPLPDDKFWTLPAYFRLSPLHKIVRKVVSDFGKRSCVGTGVRKPGNTVISVTDHHDMNLAVEVALNPNTTNQPIWTLPNWKTLQMTV